MAISKSSCRLKFSNMELHSKNLKEKVFKVEGNICARLFNWRLLLG